MTPDQMKELEGRVAANGPTMFKHDHLIHDLWACLKSSEQARDADRVRLDWIFAKLDDREIAGKLKAIGDAHAMGGGYAMLSGKPVVRMGDFRAAIDAAMSSASADGERA